MLSAGETGNYFDLLEAVEIPNKHLHVLNDTTLKPYELRATQEFFRRVVSAMLVLRRRMLLQVSASTRRRLYALL
jgi:hypothetical protein